MASGSLPPRGGCEGARKSHREKQFKSRREKEEEKAAWRRRLGSEWRASALVLVSHPLRPHAMIFFANASSEGFTSPSISHLVPILLRDAICLSGPFGQVVPLPGSLSLSLCFPPSTSRLHACSVSLPSHHPASPSFLHPTPRPTR